MKSFALLLADLSVYANLIPAAVLLFRFGRLDRTQRRLGVLIGVSLAVESVAYWLTYRGENNLPLLHLFTVLEFGLLVTIFRHHLRGPTLRRRLLVLIGFFALLAFANALWFESIWTFNVGARSVESLLLIALVILYFAQRLNAIEGADGSSAPLIAEPMFWIATAVLLYFSASLFIFLFSAVWIRPNDFSYTIWAAHAGLTIVKSILFTIALWISPPRPESTPPVSSRSA